MAGGYPQLEMIMSKFPAVVDTVTIVSMIGRKRMCAIITEKLKILRIVKKSGNKKLVDIAGDSRSPSSTLNSIVAKATDIEGSACLVCLTASIHGFKVGNILVVSKV